MKYKGQEFKSYTDIIEHAMKLKGKERKAFVTAYAKSGKFALSNIGYFAGYYGPTKRAQIHKIFNASHPIFGRFK